MAPSLFSDEMMEGKSGSRTKDYAEDVEGAYRVAGSRVSLDSIVYCFREGLSHESIVESFPTLTLEGIRRHRFLSCKLNPAAGTPTWLTSLNGAPS